MKTIDQYEIELRQQLKDSPDLILPKADEFTVDELKYTNYLFGGVTEIGLVKGRLINHILGYNINNYKDFDAKIKQAVKEFPATLKESNQFGERYEVVTVIKGLKDRKAIVLISAQYDIETSKLVTAYITNIKEVK